MARKFRGQQQCDICHKVSMLNEGTEISLTNVNERKKWVGMDRLAETVTGKLNAPLWRFRRWREKVIKYYD